MKSPFEKPAIALRCCCSFQFHSGACAFMDGAARLGSVQESCRVECDHKVR